MRRLLQSQPWSIMAETFKTLRAERVPRLGAGLAYYGLFALLPLLAISIAIAGLFFESHEVTQALELRITEVLGDDVEAGAVVERAADYVDDGSTQAGLGLIGLLSLVVGGSVFFLAYQDALNVIFQAPARSGLEFTLRRRLRVSLVVLLSGSVLVSTLIVQAVLALIDAVLPDLVDGLDLLGGFAGVAISTVLGALLLTLLVRVLVYKPVDLRSAVIAQSITAVCLGLGVAGFGVYMDRVGTKTLGGATAGVFVTIVFIYVEAQILLAGGALTKSLHDRRVGAEGSARPGPGGPEVDDGG